MAIQVVLPRQIKAALLFNKVSKESLQKTEDAATNTFIPVSLSYLLGYSGYEIRFYSYQKERRVDFGFVFSKFTETRIISFLLFFLCF